MSSTSSASTTFASSTTSSASASTTFAATPKKRYTPPRPAPLPEDYEEFYASLTQAERELDTLAKELLGSSYIIQWTHMYLKWLKVRETEKTQKIVQKSSEEKKE